MGLQAASKESRVVPARCDRGRTMNHRLMNAAAICIIAATAYLAAKEIWTFAEARQAQAQIREDQTKAALKDVLGSN